VSAAEADERVVAAALVGSNADRRADEHSDLDLVLVTTDEGFEEFCGQRDEFLRNVGEPLFSESWGRSARWFYVFSDGGDGDLTVVPASKVATAFDGPFAPLLDTAHVLDGVVVTARPPAALDEAGRWEMQRRLTGFWHDYAHFITAWQRGQWWWANGQLEVLRGMCVNLLRLTRNPTDAEVGDEPYWKLELSLGPDALARLVPTLNTFDPASMLAAGRALAALYRQLGRQLEAAHGLTYPAELERLVLARLKSAET
jgi:hypothetical protein